MLHVGNQLSADTLPLCIYHSPGNTIIVSEEMAAKVDQMISSVFNEFRKTNAFFRVKKKRENELIKIKC
jgi:hypothetical protein